MRSANPPLRTGRIEPEPTGPDEEGSGRSPRVLLVDDNDLFRRGLRTLLEDEAVEVVGEARSGGDALAGLRALAPDVVVMDLKMPGISGIDTIRQMAMVAPTARVLVLTASDGDADVSDAIMAGACGYLLKDSSLPELISGIRATAAGEPLVSPAVASKVLQQFRVATPPAHEQRMDASVLSEREMQVLRLLASGKDNARIAADLHISPKTVKNHISNILIKLEIENRIQAAVFAVRSGLA